MRGHLVSRRLFDGCSAAVVLIIFYILIIGFTCPAMTVVTVIYILRSFDRVRERALGLLDV